MTSTNKQITVEFTIKTKVSVNFLDDQNDNDTPPYFEATVVSVDQQDIFNQIQAHVTECGEDYYNDNK